MLLPVIKNSIIEVFITLKSNLRFYEFLEIKALIGESICTCYLPRRGLFPLRSQDCPDDVHQGVSFRFFIALNDKKPTYCFQKFFPGLSCAALGWPARQAHIRSLRLEV